MFGLERDDNSVDFSYDIEQDFKDSRKKKLIQDELEDRTSKLKHLLREGKNQELFDQYGTLLHGYISMKKVMERARATVK